MFINDYFLVCIVEGYQLSDADEISRKVIRIAVIGDAGTGKTSLVLRFFGRSFNPKYKPTIGASFYVEKIDCEEFPVRANLLIWDISGSSTFESIRKLYYMGVDVIIIVFDMSNKASFSNVERWIEEVLNVIGFSPIIIVGNKRDLGRCSVDIEEVKKIIEDYSKKYGVPIRFIEVSAKDNYNVGKVFREAVKLYLEYESIMKESINVDEMLKRPRREVLEKIALLLSYIDTRKEVDLFLSLEPVSIGNEVMINGEKYRLRKKSPKEIVLVRE